MSFTSIKFLYFLAAFLVVYALCPARYRRYALLVGSLVFCFMGSVRMAVSVLCFSIVNYVLGGLLQTRDPIRKRVVLIVGVALNAGALIVFKLTGTMPTGVSFYTFACISYLVDVSRSDVDPEPNLLKFTTYLTMFPKVQQGPMARYKELSPQMDRPRQTLQNVQAGLESFILGISMKVLLADKLAILWNELVKIGFESISTPLAWLGIFGYSLQLYLDFQGYTLMAIGIGRMLGFQFPSNFNFPYLAKTIGDFYRRWHMTLTGWFKDYIYIPLGGNRKGTLRTAANILIVWLITSLWHGLGWNYLLWGMSIGLLIVLEKLFLGKAMNKLHVLPHLYVLFFIPLTWCCFAITDISQLGVYFTRLFPFLGGTVGNVYQGDFAMYLGQFAPYLIGGVFCCFPILERFVKRYGRNPIVSMLLAALFWWAVFEIQRSGNNPFLYLNF